MRKILIGLAVLATITAPLAVPGAGFAATSQGFNASLTAHAQRLDAGFDFVVSVTTSTTSCKGERDGRTSDWTKVTAPAGSRINRGTLSVEWIVSRGSENSHEVRWGDWILPQSESPDFKAPKTIAVRVSARSSKGLCAGSGKSEIRVTGQFVSGGDQEVPTTPPADGGPLPEA